MVPVWTEVLADLETPVAAYAKLVGDGAGLPARVGRARRALEPVQLRRARPVGHARAARRRDRPSTATCPTSVPLDRGMLAALDDAAARSTERPIIADLPPLQGGVMGYLGYDVVREVERLPDVPHDDRQLPDAVMSVIGSLAAFDHWRQRVYLIESVPVLGLDDDELDAAYDAAIRRVEAGRRRSRPAAAVRAGRAAASRTRRCPRCAARCRTGMYQQAVEVAKEHIVAGDIFQVVLSQRYDLDLDADPFDVYRVLRQVNPSPYMYFLRHPDDHDRRLRRPSRWCRCSAAR